MYNKYTVDIPLCTRKKLYNFKYFTESFYVTRNAIYNTLVTDVILYSLHLYIIETTDRWIILYSVTWYYRQVHTFVVSIYQLQIILSQACSQDSPKGGFNLSQ